MDKPYFVMLYYQNGEGATPMLNEEDEVQFYATFKEAEDAGGRNFMGKNFGFSVFSMDEPLL
jgi:hypothetical protein